MVFRPSPLKNDGVSSSVGMMFHSHMESHKSHVNQTTNQIDIVTSRKKKNVAISGAPTSMCFLSEESLKKLAEKTPRLRFGESLIWLVVDQPLWKMMEFVNGKDDIPYMNWKIKVMWTKPPSRCFFHGRYTYIWPMFGVNVGQYSMDGALGYGSWGL